jgi:uncharacterized SAM-binding protein YcdF (DUF218 family)
LVGLGLKPRQLASGRVQVVASRRYVHPVMLDAIVLLGCRIGPSGWPSETARRRAERAADAWHQRMAPLVVVSGGRRWHGLTEAEALENYLAERRGVPRTAILRECCSLSTSENARFTARLLRARGLVEIGIVTSDWHIPRAMGAFRRMGLSCQALPAPSPPTRRWLRAYRSVREAVSQRLDSWLARELT